MVLRCFNSRSICAIALHARTPGYIFDGLSLRCRHRVRWGLYALQINSSGRWKFSQDGSVLWSGTRLNSWNSFDACRQHPKRGNEPEFDVGKAKYRAQVLNVIIRR